MQVVKHLRRLKGVALLLEELVEGVHGGVHGCWQWGSEGKLKLKPAKT